VLQLQIENCHRDDVEQLSIALEEHHALSITLTDKHDDPILEPELGTTPLWPNVVLHALYAEKHAADCALQSLSADFPNLRYSLQELPEQDWERVCMDDFKPQQFGHRLWICPSWLTPPDSEAVNLILDPGLAFGTGTHPTTTLCLTWLEQANLHSKTMIDYGCGSGILALAALKLGAMHVDAVDIDQQALLATQNNAITNGIPKAQLTIGYPEQLETSVDLLIANILLTPLIQLQSQFNQLLKNKGTLVVSGILSEQANDLIIAYHPHFKHISTETRDGWSLLVFSSRCDFQ
jgi:ribosomal protein L11 methyltransferase